MVVPYLITGVFKTLRFKFKNYAHFSEKGTLHTASCPVYGMGMTLSHLQTHILDSCWRYGFPNQSFMFMVCTSKSYEAIT